MIRTKPIENEKKNINENRHMCLYTVVVNKIATFSMSLIRKHVCIHLSFCRVERKKKCEWHRAPTVNYSQLMYDRNDKSFSLLGAT